MKQEQKLSCTSSFQLTKIVEGCKMPKNEEAVLIYTALEGNIEAMCEPAIYLVAGTVVDCGINMSKLKGISPEEKLCNAIHGQGEVSMAIQHTGFYSSYLDDNDIMHYQYLNPDYICAWVRIPKVMINKALTDDSVISVAELEDATRRYDCISKSQIAYDIDKAFRNQDASITGVRLDIFYNPNKGYLEEYVVVTYSGGAIAARNNSMNSVTATYKAIGELVNGGYYDEVKAYEEIAADPAWKKVDVSAYLK